MFADVLSIKAQYFMKDCPQHNWESLSPNCRQDLDLIIGIQMDLKYKYTYENAGVFYALYRWFQNVKIVEQTIEIFHNLSLRNVKTATSPLIMTCFSVGPGKIFEVEISSENVYTKQPYVLGRN